MHAIHYETESIKNLELKKWELVPQNIKEESSLSSFKDKVKKWILKDYPCRLCKIFIALNAWLIEELCSPRQTFSFLLQASA